MKSAIYKIITMAVCGFAGTVFAEITSSVSFDWGFSNVVQTVEGETEYVVAYTNTQQTHTFKVPNGVYSMQYLVVAGGGGGGGSYGNKYGVGGGGGAGGMKMGSDVQVAPGDSLDITVGIGGAGGSDQNGYQGVNGGNSSIQSGSTYLVEAHGGGGGGAYVESEQLTEKLCGLNGGSGGGAAGASRSDWDNVAVSGGSALEEGEGNNGASREKATSYCGGCGGGGAGAPGGTGGGSTGGSGGVGLPCSITGEEIYYAGGGSGQTPSATNGDPAGGNGGGGRGGSGQGENGKGGGGGGAKGNGKVGGAGGSGIVIIRYAVVNIANGIAINYDGVSYTNSVPGYGTYLELPTNEFTCAVSVEVEAGVASRCAGWSLYDMDGALVRSSDTTDREGESPTKMILLEDEGGYTLTWHWVLDVADGVTVYYDGQSIGGKTDDNQYVPGQSSYEISCQRYVTLEENAERLSCIGYTLKTLPDGEESDVITEGLVFSDDAVTATIQYSEPVKLTWKWTNEFYVATEAAGRGSLKENKSGWYRVGDTVSGIEVAATENFLGWCVPGATAEARSGTSISVTVSDAPITVTAYFTENDKDNLVLNGDFEINSDPSYYFSHLGNFNRLTAGSWSIVNNVGGNYASGLLASTTGNSFASNMKTYDGLSAALTSTTSTEGSIRCEEIGRAHV